MFASTPLSIGSLSPHLLNSSNQTPLKSFAHPPVRNPSFKSSNPFNGRKLAIPVKTSAATADSAGHIDKEAEAKAKGGGGGGGGDSKKYHFVVANAKFMLDEEEHFKELLSERLRCFEERNRAQDFWLVVEPKWLEKFPDVTRRLKRSAVALVSTNGPWITFVKLRLDRVLQGSFESESLEEALAYNPVNLDFETPEKWTAPYPKYEYRWWDPFLPPENVRAFEV